MEYKFLFNDEEKNLMKNIGEIGAINDCMTNVKSGLNDKMLNNEYLPIFMILDSLLTIRENDKILKLHVEDYIRDYSSNEVKEVITKKRNGKSAYGFINTELEDLNSLTSAIYLEMNDGKISNYRAAIGGNNIVPFRLYEIENLIKGKELDYLQKDKVINILSKNIVKKLNRKYKLNVNKDIIEGLYRGTLRNVIGRIKEEI